MNFSSQLLEQAVHQISRLPGIGKKSALRLVLHLLKQSKEDVGALSQSLTRLRNEIQYCSKCYNISDETICQICSSRSRKQELICVVENIRDLIALENTQQFNGVYHVLGGLISPIDGIGPEQLKIKELIDRCEQDEVAEIILAISPTIEGDTTAYYIEKKLNSNIKMTALARGVSFGGELEYADDLTLGKSIANRVLLKKDNL